MELYILTSVMCVMCHMCHGQKLDSMRFTHKLSDDSRMIINPFPSLMNGLMNDVTPMMYPLVN